MSSLKALLYFLELNTLDACWIAVDEWSNSSRCRQESVYLSRTWCLYTWSYLDILITMLNSVNCSTVICSPTVKYLCSWEKPLVKPMAPGSILIISISITLILLCFLLCLYFLLCIFIPKIPKILYLSDLTLVSDHEGIDNPFIVLVARFLFLCVGTRDLRVASYWIDTLVLKNWGKYLRYFAASPFPLQGKTNAVLKR